MAAGHKQLRRLSKQVPGGSKHNKNSAPYKFLAMIRGIYSEKLNILTQKLEEEFKNNGKIPLWGVKKTTLPPNQDFSTYMISGTQKQHSHQI